VQSLCFSPDGSLLASTADDGSVCIWNVSTKDDTDRTQARIQQSVSKEDLWNLAFSPNGQLLAAQLENSTLGVWDVNDGQLCYAIEETLFGEGCLDFSRDSSRLITGSTDGTVRLWDAATGELRHALERHQGSVLSLAVSSDGRHIASSSADGTIRVWDIQTRSCARTMRPPGPYEGMDISGATGLSPAQTAVLKMLGAVNDRNEDPKNGFGPAGRI
jgi:WD40 repeat protein